MLESLSVVLPVYNEAECIQNVLYDVMAFLEKHCSCYEVIVVDDGSVDGSAEIMERIATQYASLHVFRHEKNKGYGAALLSGFNRAVYDYIFFMDADGQFRIEDICLLEPYIHECDIVVGCRQKRRDSLFRIMLGQLFTTIINVCYRIYAVDLNCAFKVMKRSDLLGLGLTIQGPLINAEILVKARQKGLNIRTCKVPHYPRSSGQATGAKISTIIRAGRDFLQLMRQI